MEDCFIFCLHISSIQQRDHPFGRRFTRVMLPWCKYGVEMNRLTSVTLPLLHLAAVFIHTAHFFDVSTGPDPLVALIGDNVTLSWHFSPKETTGLTLQWNHQKNNVYLYDNGFEVLTNQFQQFQNRVWFNVSGLLDGNATLVLNNVGVSDEGIYSYYMSNDNDRAEKTRQLLVMAPYLTFTVTCLPRCQHFTRPDENITLVCRAIGGYPQAQLTWTFNGTSRMESDGINITQGPEKTFSIQSQLMAQARNVSMIECTLWNSRSANRSAQYSSFISAESSHAKPRRVTQSAIFGSCLLALIFASKVW